MTIDPATMTDATLAARLADEQRRTPELKAAAEYAAQQVTENTTAIRVLQTEAAFRAAAKELRRKSSAARVAVLRTLAAAEKPIDIDGPTEWLVSRRLIHSHYISRGHHRYTITDLGRRALTALESA